MPAAAAASATRVAHLLSRFQNLCAKVLNALTGGDASLEQATTIKTLVSGPPHRAIADRTWPASEGPSGVWSGDSGSRHGDSHATSIDFGAWCRPCFRGMQHNYVQELGCI